MNLPLKGSCHCGAVTLSVHLPQGTKPSNYCDCSLCRRKGAIMLTATLDGLTINSGADRLTLYQFNSHTAKHYFCSICGIYTHHQRRSNSNEYGVNAGIFDALDLRALTPYMADGINHPADQN